MKKSFSFKSIAIAFVASTSLLLSCQKDQLAKPEEQRQAELVMKANASKQSKQKLKNDANKEYDKEMKKLLQEMSKQMKKMKMTCEPDVDFANMMIMHHDMGIAMANLELAYGHHARGKELAEKTKIGNQESKERLQAFLSAHTSWMELSKADCENFMMEMMSSMEKMMMEMEKLQDLNDVDVQFAEQMIVHHQAAIEMSRIELKWGHEPAAKAEAQKIIDEQSAEIAELKAFVNSHQ